MKEFENPIPFSNLEAIQLCSQPAAIIEEFSRRQGNEPQIFRREGNEYFAYRIVVRDNEIRAESEVQKTAGTGPQKIVALDCGPFFIARRDLSTLQEIHSTFINKSELADIKTRPNIGWETPKTHRNKVWVVPDLQFYCDHLLSQMTTIAITPDQDRQTRFRELNVSAQSGALSIKGHTSLPRGMGYYHSFLDELSLLAQEICGLHSIFQTEKKGPAPSRPDGRIMDLCRRSFKLILAPSSIGSTEAILYKPFTDIHSTLYYAVHPKRKWHSDEKTEKNRVHFLAGKTYEIHADEQIYKNARAEWRISIAATCNQA